MPCLLVVKMRGSKLFIRDTNFKLPGSRRVPHVVARVASPYRRLESLSFLDDLQRRVDLLMSSHGVFKVCLDLCLDIELY